MYRHCKCSMFMQTFRVFYEYGNRVYLLFNVYISAYVYVNFHSLYYTILLADSTWRCSRII